MKLYIKFAIGCILTVLIFILAVKYFGRHYLEKKISHYIRDSTNGKYQFATEKLDISLFPPGVTADNLKITSNDQTYIKADSDLYLLPELTIAQLELKGIDIFSLFFNHKFSASDLEIDKPSIELLGATDGVPSISLAANHGNAQSNFQLENMHIEGGTFGWQKGNAMATSNFSINGNHIKTEKKNFDIGEFLIKVTQIQYRTADSLYLIKCDSMTLDRVNQRAELNNIKISPLVEKYEIGQMVGHEKDWISASLEGIVVEGVKFDQLIENNFTAKKFYVNNFSALVFRDKRLPFPNIPDKPLLHKSFSQMAPEVNIDSIFMTSKDITYQERAIGSANAGEISFNNLKASGTSLHNRQKTNFDMDVQAWVMGKGLLEANFKFPLSQPNKQPVITGTLHEMKLNRLNPMFNYVAAVEIESGICHQMDFNFTYDEYQSSGQLAFNYNNLNIHFINDKRGNEERNNNDELLSFISKAIITKTSQRNDNNIRSGKIKFKRDPKKSILNYWWKSLFSGVKSSVIWNLKKEISPS